MSTKASSVSTPAKRSWFYSTLSQALIIGAVAFLGPGMYNAIGNLGAGGLASATAWNNATALLFSLLCFSCIFSPIIINQLPLRYSLAFSACTYTLYASSLYCNSKNGNEWWLVLANAISGIGSGVFFATEGAVVVGYPEPSRRGKYVAGWVFMRNLGPIVGGAILLGLNIKTDGAGSVSLTSYAAIMGIMCAAPFVSLLLANPDKVQRSDGTKVVLAKTDITMEAKVSWKMLTSRKVLLLLPIFFASWFYDSFISNYNAAHFNVRTRALSAFITPFAGNIGSFLVGSYLDSSIGRRSFRAMHAFTFIILLQFAMWTYTAINTAHYNSLATSKFDWRDNGFGRAYTLTFLWMFEGLAFQSFLYWITGTLSNDMNELVHLTGILRGIEGAGQAVAYGIAASTASKFVHIGLGLGLIVFSAPLAYLVVREVSDNTNGEATYLPETAKHRQQQEAEVGSIAASPVEKDTESV